MSKYQDALDFLSEECREIKKGEAKKHINTLQELIDKATPKRPIKRTLNTKHGALSDFGCPICGNRVNDYEDYCCRCAQTLDWSEYDEE